MTIFPFFLNRQVNSCKQVSRWCGLFSIKQCVNSYYVLWAIQINLAFTLLRYLVLIFDWIVLFVILYEIIRICVRILSIGLCYLNFFFIWHFILQKRRFLSKQQFLHLLCRFGLLLRQVRCVQRLYHVGSLHLDLADASNKTCVATIWTDPLAMLMNDWCRTQLARSLFFSILVGSVSLEQRCHATTWPLFSDGFLTALATFHRNRLFR